MLQRNDATGLILAGGAGRRMGGRDKGLIEWQGKSLITHAIERLRPQVHHLVISCNRNRVAYRTFNFPIVHDKRTNYQGPLAGIEAAADIVRTRFLIIVPCDTPALPDRFVERLLEPLRDGCTDNAKISYACDGKQNHYLCTALHISALSGLSAYLDSGQRSVRGWYAQQSAVSVDFSAQPEAFANVNYTH